MEAFLTALKKWFEAKSQKQKVFIALIGISLFCTGILLSFGNSSNITEDPLGSSPLYFFSAFVKLIVVLLLIVGCSILFRRWLQMGPTNRTMRQMNLIETIRLTPKQALHLVRIGDRDLILGATDQNISLLASIDVETDSTTKPDSQLQPALDFGAMLQSFTDKE